MKQIVGLMVLFSLNATAETVGQVGMVEGEVIVDNRPVKKTAPVSEGSTVEVKRGKATLLLGKGNVFHLSSDSKIVVKKFDVVAATKTSAGSEAGELDFKFGRTRALILNQGADKKDLKIKARAATMGVRGTEIYIDAPQDSKAPINFFTLEGKAEVKSNEMTRPVVIAQNQGVSTHGAPAPAGSGGGDGAKGGAADAGKGGGGEGNKGGAQGGAQGGGPVAQGDMKPPTMSVGQVQNNISEGGMASEPIHTPQDLRRQVTQQYMSDQFGMGALPPVVLDPLQDRFIPVRIQPRFCDATSACP